MFFTYLFAGGQQAGLSVHAEFKNRDSRPGMRVFVVYNGENLKEKLYVKPWQLQKMNY